MKALIFENKVIDKSEIEFAVHPDMFWVDCDFSVVEIGYGYEGKTFKSFLPTPEEQAEFDKAQLIQETKKYLTLTDFYMTVDKYATLSPEKQAELTQLRAEARALINTLEG